MDTQVVINEGEGLMGQSREALRGDLNAIRTGRASPALVENILVDYYGTPTPITHVAAVSSPEARLLVIQPWDKSAIAAIEKALLKSELGITPNNDGTVIRITLPIPTEERRKELVRVVKRRVEDARLSIRNVRRDVLDKLRAMEREKALSQDDGRRAQEALQRVTDAWIEQINAIGVAKETEVLEV